MTAEARQGPAKAPGGPLAARRQPRQGVGGPSRGARCLETRLRADGLRYRRYRDALGLTQWTVEVPLEVWSSINRQGRARNRLEEHARRVERDGKRAAGLCLLQEGWKALAVAAELGVGVRTVQRWKKHESEL